LFSTTLRSEYNALRVCRTNTEEVMYIDIPVQDEYNLNLLRIQ
jgi:hypothetical protein